MKNNRVVIWGTNAQNEKVLIALELQTDTNKVMLYTFPQAIADRNFETQLTDEWRKGGTIDFPEGHTLLERELSVTESLLPEDLKVDRPDIIQRAQTEWHFAVLSAKLHHAYEQELAEFKEKIENLQEYDAKIFNALRKFWEKIKTQSRERNLFREQADQLRDNTNALFERLKQIRARAEGEISETSQKVYEEFTDVLTAIEQRIASGSAKLQHIFDDLKQLQQRYREARLTNEHRESIWTRIDKAYKTAKERRYGAGVNEGSLAERHTRRLEGLMAAIRRLEDSIKRDDDELKFQRKRIAGAEGQLEAQIREAKIKMVEERANSKREQLADMNKTRAEVERQIEDAKGRDAKRAEKEDNRRKVEEAKAKAKAEIAADMKAKNEANAGAVERAKAVADAEAKEGVSNLTAAPQPEAESAEPEAEKPGFFDNLGTTLTEAFEDAVDTVKAVASVAADKAAPMLDAAAEKAGDMFDSAKETASDLYDKASEKAAPVLEAAAEKAGDIFESAKETASELYDKASEKAGPVLEAAAEKAGELVEAVKEKAGDVLDKMKRDKSEEPAAVAEAPVEEPAADETPAKSGKKSKPAAKSAAEEAPTEEVASVFSDEADQAADAKDGEA